jgi:alkylation response protein AidB-like acyl-CoA dehydrogenase
MLTAQQPTFQSTPPSNPTPVAEISLLRSSGQLKVLGATKYGGGGQGWDGADQVIREVAMGDGRLGMLLGYHLLWLTTAGIVETEEQKGRFATMTVETNSFVGG